ncbi:MAG TPA: DUF3750 domain-containing protein [Alphaproteobacteria bacterium]
MFQNGNDWQKASRESVGIAPKPDQEKRAIVQIYAARAHGWRGNYAVHSWIATKDKNASFYNVYQVVGWRSRRGLGVVSIERDLPDRKWFDHEPELLFELKGAGAEKMIPQLKIAAKHYPYPDSYRLFPGPNSNSFIAYMIRHTPGIYVELPPHAIGKDWVDDGKFFARSETGTGYQFSLYGLFGITVGLAEGFEVNILGLCFGIDVARPALKLPFIGRLGLKDRPLYGPKAIPETEKAPDKDDPMVSPGTISTTE